MRHLFGFLCVCALSVMPLVGCGDETEFECQTRDDCEDDGNECTVESCHYATHACERGISPNGKECDFDGLAGVCIEGVCEEDLCAGVVCNDGDLCTYDRCDYMDGTCHFNAKCLTDVNECTEDGCNPADGSCVFTPVPDGRSCCPSLLGCFFSWEYGRCEDGVCVVTGL